MSLSLANGIALAAVVMSGASLLYGVLATLRHSSHDYIEMLEKQNREKDVALTRCRDREEQLEKDNLRLMRELFTERGKNGRG